MLSILYLDIERIYNIIIFLFFPQSLKGVLKIFTLSLEFVVTSLDHHGGEEQVRPGFSLLPPAVVEDGLVENEGEASSGQGEDEEEGLV